MTLAVDFSFQKPSPQALLAHGIKIAIGYLTGAGKAFTAEQVSAYVDAGLPVVFVYEVTANDVAGGEAGGRLAAAAAAIALANLIGENEAATVPIYFTVDENVAVGSVVAYFVGINQVLPGFPAVDVGNQADRSRVGAYADGVILDYLGAVGLADWFYQSSSASYPGNKVTIPAAHIRQLPGPSPIPGTDLDTLLQGDVGQYPRPS